MMTSGRRRAMAYRGEMRKPAMERMVRKRGRPATLTAETVLNAALDLGASDPLTPVSVKMVARRLNVSSMAIYKYFSSRDDLLQAMSSRLLEGFRLEYRHDASALEQIEAWLIAMRRHLLANKQLINLISWDSGAISNAWQNHTAPLYKALQKLGLSAELQAQTALWIMISGMGSIVFEVRSQLTRVSDEVQNPASLLPEVTEGNALVAEFRQRPDHDEQLFDFVIKRIIQSLPNSDTSTLDYSI